MSSAVPRETLRNAWLALVAAMVLGAVVAEVLSGRVTDGEAGTLPPVDVGPFTGEPESGHHAVGSGPLPAGFLQGSTGIMAALEGWRGRAFTADVTITWRAMDAQGRWGWYDAERDTLVVVEPPDPSLGPMTLVHELQHALQDQHFDLAAMHPADPGSDAGLARLALIEGEAMLAGSELLGIGLDLHGGLPATRDLSDEQMEVLFLYMDGARFVESLRSAGGWQRVDAAWARPPTCTAAILDPLWYRAGGLPTEPDALGGGDRAGAFALMKWLAAAPAVRGEARELARVWRGDARRTEGPDEVWVVELLDADAAGRLAAASEAVLPDGGSAEVAGPRVTLRWPTAEAPQAAN